MFGEVSIMSEPDLAVVMDMVAVVPQIRHRTIRSQVGCSPAGTVKGTAKRERKGTTGKGTLREQTVMEFRGYSRSEELIHEGIGLWGYTVRSERFFQLINSSRRRAR